MAGSSTCRRPWRWSPRRRSPRPPGPVAGTRAASMLVSGTTDSVTNIDPANEYDYGSFTLDLLLFQGLYGYPARREARAGAGDQVRAQRAPRSPGPARCRRNVKFADGTPMTSADVKYSFDRVQKIKGDQGIYALLSNLKSTSTNGPYGVTFHLKSPQSTWPFILATNAGLHRRRRRSTRPTRSATTPSRRSAPGRTSWSSTRPASRPSSRRTRTTGGRSRRTTT